MQEQKVKYFETYEVKSSDLETLQQDINTLVKSGLFEKVILDEIRFVTYDSKYLYIFTRGQHATNEKFCVEEISSLSKTGFKIFKIAHSGFIGKDRDDYRGAMSWLLCDEIETTSVNAKKFPNENILYQPDLSQQKKILNVVSMAPKEPYDKIQKGRFNYLTDVIFHEAGHIELRMLENWQGGEEKIATFPSAEQKEIFLSVVRRTNIFPEWIVNLIIENINIRAIREMYPMLIDREAAKRYDVQKFNDENNVFKKTLVKIQSEHRNQKFIVRFKKSLKNSHITGRLLARILEERFPDFNKRKKFVRSVLKRKNGK